MADAEAWDADPARRWETPAEEGRLRVDLKVDVPHAARMYDYFLGGKDNFAVDREAADKVAAVYPTMVATARQNRTFMTRVVRHLAGEAGIRQFLDIGTGLPTSPNVHEIAQGIGPEARVAYADNDPIVLIHARALLTSSREGKTVYLDADLRDPDSILGARELRETLDFTQPTALSLIATLPYVPGDEAFDVVRRLVDALPAGSYLALSHVTADINPAMEEVAETYRKRGIPTAARSHAEVGRFFSGLELIDPGLVLIHHWRPDEGTDTGMTDADVSIYGGVARK